MSKNGRSQLLHRTVFMCGWHATSTRRGSELIAQSCAQNVQSIGPYNQRTAIESFSRPYPRTRTVIQRFNLLHASRTMSKKMQNQLFNLKFTAKQLGRNSKKALKNEKAMKTKLKKAIEAGNTDGARIYAQNAIREKNQALNMLRLQSRVEAVAARVQTAVDMNSVSKAMGGVVNGMNAALTGGAMDVNKLTQIMDQFEKNSDDLEVRTAYMEGTMSSSTATSTPEDEVDGLIRQVADENNLQLMEELGSVGKVGTATATSEATADKKADPALDDLAARLAALHK